MVLLARFRQHAIGAQEPESPIIRRERLVALSIAWALVLARNFVFLRYESSLFDSDRANASYRQTVAFAAAGRVLDTVTLRDQTWVAVKRPLPPPSTPATNWLELHVGPPWRPRGEARMLGVQTRDIKFGP